MPARSRLIPHNLERSALQKMSADIGLPLRKLHPAGQKTIPAMLAKGWIEEQTDADGMSGYVFTPAGEAALKAKIPVGY